ncbi:MAG: iron-containing alcohol dehydrogenase [Candidatus Humimicrobiaceae bacterium]
MENFELCIPTRIVFGKDRVHEVGKYAKDYGKKLLLVYGKGSIKKHGIYDEVINSLKEQNLEIVEHPGVKSNPVLSHVNEGIAIAKRENVDFILAVGGGSVIDSAKAIAAGALYDGDVWDFYKGTEDIKEALPVLTVITIPATASEMNGGTVLTNEETNDKFGFIDDHLFPKVSILDPTVTYTIKKEYTGYSAIDACIHLLEGYFTHDDVWLPIQDRYAEGLVKTIMESANILMEKPEDYDGRATLMWAASLAWNGLGTAGVEGADVHCHMFAHILGAHYDIAHGAALSIIVPGWMKYMLDKKAKRFARFTKNVLGIEGKDDKDTASKGIEAFEGWFKEVGGPVSFKDANLPTDELDKLADSVLDLAEVWEIEDYSREDIIEVFKRCL